MKHYEKRVSEGATVKGIAMFVCSSRPIAYELYKEIIALRPEWAEVKVGDSSSVDAPSQSSIQRKRRSKPTFQEYQNELRRNLNNDKGKHESKQLRIYMNDFPYYFAPGIQHWVLWKLGGDVTSDEILQAKKCIFRDDYQLKHIIHNDIIVNSTEVFLHWVNPPHLKSLPGIDHVHILFRVQN